MKRRARQGWLLLSSALLTSLLWGADASKPAATRLLPGGETTVTASGSRAFSLPAATMPLSQRLNFSVGNSFFRNPWVSAPASTDARDGLGPLFNTNACQNCHIRDGRGHAPDPAGPDATSFLLRMSLPARTRAEHAIARRHGVLPVPRYGTQLQDFSLPGAQPEGRVRVHYDSHSLRFRDGTAVTLQKPRFSIDQPARGPLPDTVLLSGRIATPMIGLGLLEAIPEATLLALADPDDRDGDGISGRLNRVRDIAAGEFRAGRFGWKAGQPSVRQQTATAFSDDMGLTTSLLPDEHCGADCGVFVSGGSPEVSDAIFEQVVFYSRNLAVPDHRHRSDPAVIRGAALFDALRCSACHRPQLQTGPSDLPWLAHQTIAPYTDLLLHDMGEGLADQRPEFAATGREWRTAPLWGLGYTDEVGGDLAGRGRFLHDGRARSLMEAVLWHGGEAQASRDAVLNLPRDERDALLRFLESL